MTVKTITKTLTKMIDAVNVVDIIVFEIIKLECVGHIKNEWERRYET